MYYIKDEKTLQVESFGERNAKYKDFLADLQKSGESECRYGLYDFKYEPYHRTTSSSFMQKIILIAWRPRSAESRNRDLYDLCSDIIKKALVGVDDSKDAEDLDEASEESVEWWLQMGDRD